MDTRVDDVDRAAAARARAQAELEWARAWRDRRALEAEHALVAALREIYARGGPAGPRVERGCGGD